MTEAAGSLDLLAAAELWWPVVSGSRWFQGKSRGGSLRGLATLPWLVSTPQLLVRPELVTVAYPPGDEETYQLLVAYRPGGTGGPATVGRLELDGVPHEVSDASRDPEAMAAVLPALTRDAVYEGVNSLVSHYVRPIAEGDLTVRLFTGEQSNTNVFFGTAAMLKIFRKLEPGPNLDREITDKLLRAGVNDVPVLYGWLAADSGSGVPDDLMMLTEVLADPVDGWHLATDSVRHGGDFTADAAALGRALGEVHSALAEGNETIEGDAVADLMAQRLDAAVAAAPILGPYRDGLAARFEALRGHELAAQPVHGDFHLGQTLRTPAGWRIIDFEGEPMKPMAQRRRPDSPWRDVAGMVRSLSYATSAAPDLGAAATRDWLQSAREAFVTAYGETAGCHVDEAVLAAYETDKVTYEVVYETRNRPDWVQIPLASVVALSTTTASQRS